eukprot:GHVO01065095.1.p1 GENE.GHVO01065095.1~~GHVO01065095.1.p1  ORF type:complete len:118 (-),score=0.04 GHVO01065095.1:333-686(-)
MDIDLILLQREQYPSYQQQRICYHVEAVTFFYVQNTIEDVQSPEGMRHRSLHPSIKHLHQLILFSLPTAKLLMKYMLYYTIIFMITILLYLITQLGMLCTYYNMWSLYNYAFMIMDL